MAETQHAQTLETSALNYFHHNPRRGDVAAIKASLEANGQFRPIVVNEGTETGRPMEVLAGNHTLRAIRQLAEEHPDDERWATVDAWVIDVDDERATRIVLADNRTADRADYDLTELMELLDDTEELEGTGYDDDDLDDLKAAQEELEAEAFDDEPGDTTTPEGVETPLQPEATTDTPASATPGPEAPTAPEATRMFAIHFPLAQFVWVQQALDKWHTDHPDADGANAIAVKELLERAL